MRAAAAGVAGAAPWARAASGPMLLAMLAMLAGCAGVATAPGGKGGAELPVTGAKRGGYYQDDGPGDNPPPGLHDVPDARPKIEAYSTRANRPYVVFGKTYTPFTDEQPYVQRGIGSWYGRKFHGQRTSSGEPYDMYQMTAAHPTLPIPSYARLTSSVNGRAVIVRINDRGPFHSSRAIDVSYTAALKLGLLGPGSHELKIERLLAADIARIEAARGVAPTPVVPAPAPLPLGPQAAAAFTPTPTPTSATSTSTPRAAYYLQLGAFAQAGNAQLLRRRLLSLASVAAPLEVVQTGAVQRLYSGPFASPAAASLAAAALPAALGLKPIIVQREGT